MKLSFVNVILVCSIVSVPALALSQERERPGGQQPPAGKPAQEPRKPQKEDPPKKDPARAEPRQGERDHSRLDQAMADLEKRSADGKLGKDDIAKLRQLVDEDTNVAPGNPRATRMRERLNGQIADLEVRAQNAQLQKADVISLRERIVDMRLDNALADLDARAQQKGIDRQDFERIKGLLAQRGEVVKSTGDAEELAFEQSLRDKLGTQLDELEKRGVNTIEPKDIAAIREPIVERRLDRAVSNLERNAMAKRATDADMQAVRDAIADRGEVAGNVPNGQSVHERYLNVLEGMKEKVISGQITREEFAQLRAQLTQKAREASGPKK